MGKTMNSVDFRKELIKIMPGYKWTVHRPNIYIKRFLSATGITTSGFNRLSTLDIIRREKNGCVEYEVKSAGFGKNAPWLSEYESPTLAQALRGLQNHYENRARVYRGHALALEYARKKHMEG